MSELLLSKKFIPTYFIVALLLVVLFRYLGNSWLSAVIAGFPCFIVGIIAITQNFGANKK